MTSSDAMKAEVLPENYDQYDLTFKILVIGDAYVGKSYLTDKAAKGLFNDSYSPTIGFQFLSFNVKIDGKAIKLQIWDICGQEAYRSLISNYYENASLVMMVYAIDSKESFTHIETWLKEVKLRCNPDIKIFLIGNKADLVDQRVVQEAEAKSFKDENGIHFFLETSAKTGLNAQKVFIEAAKLLYNENLKCKARANKTDSNGGNMNKSIKIDNTNNNLLEENQNLKNQINILTKENNTLKATIASLTNDKNNLQSTLAVKNTEINNLGIQINTLNNKINDLNSQLNNFRMGNNQTNNLINQMNNLNINNNTNGMVNRNEMIAILFKSVDKKVEMPYACHITDEFHNIEQELYKEYPELKEVNTYFTVNGQTIKRFKTITENNIKNYDIVILNIFE